MQHSFLLADTSEGYSLDCCLREFFDQRQDDEHDALTDAINLSKICRRATELNGGYSTHGELILDYEHTFPVTSVLERAVGVERKNAIIIIENAVYGICRSENPRCVGKIDNWIADRGFGFIQPTNKGTSCLGNIFVHISAFNQSVDSTTLQRGQRVLFGLEINTQYDHRNERSTRYQAHSVTFM